MAFNKDGLFLIGNGNGYGTLSRNMWMYVTTDAIATVNTAAYFPDGYGLKEDDGMRVVDITNHKHYDVIVKADFDVTDGVEITGTDTD